MSHPPPRQEPGNQPWPRTEPRGNAGLRPDFWVFWGGQAISTLGSSFTQFAIPLLIFRLTGSALNLSVSMAAAFLPNLLFGLLIGAWVDRLNRKRLMIVTNALMALTVGSIPLAATLGHLSVAWIYSAQFVTATMRLFFATAAMAAVVSLVARDRLVEANGRIQASYSAMSVVGPVLAGALAAVLPLEALLVVDALSYLVSAGALLAVRRSFDSPDRPSYSKSIRHDVLEGLRYVIGHPVLRNISLMMAFVNFVSMTVAAQLVFFAKVQLHASNTQVGLVFSANAAGILLLSLLAAPLRRRLTFRWVALGALQLQAILTVAMAQLHLFWPVLVLMAAWQGLGMLFMINTTSLRQSVAPHHLLGRVVMTANVVGGSVIPLGTLAGGFAIERTGNIALVYTAIGALVFLIPLIFARTALGHAERYVEAAEQTESALRRVG